MPDRRPTPRRRRLRIWAIGLAPLVVLAVLLLVVSVRRETAGPAVAADQPGPVLLVPGYGGGTGALDALAADLRAQGRDAEVVPPVGDDTGDLRVQAQALQKVVAAKLAAGAPSVDVVGYSAGGVVTRIWAADEGGAREARRIVTLGSPHHGTDVAALGSALLQKGCPTACQQLAPGSDLLTGLPETPKGPRWTSIWTSDDQVVTPPDSARLSGALDIELQQICSDEQVSHSQLPTDPLAVGLVELALGTTPPSAVPPASQCSSLRVGG